MIASQCALISLIANWSPTHLQECFRTKLILKDYTGTYLSHSGHYHKIVIVIDHDMTGPPNMVRGEKGGLLNKVTT